MNTKNDVISIRVSDLEANKKYLAALRFKINEMSDQQFFGIINDKIVVVVLEPQNDKSISRGIGIELWFSVPDIQSHYDQAKQNGINISVDLGNRGYGKQGDYSTISPDGYCFCFSQPD